MPELWFIRHGEATHNVDAMLRGATAYSDPIHLDSELTDNGQSQVIAARSGVPRNFAAIYCSPLRRCRQTLMGVGAVGRVFLDDRLMEPQGDHVCNRRIERDSLIKVVPAEWDLTGVASVNLFDAGSETPSIFSARVRAVTAAIVARHTDDEQIFIVAHHDWIRAWFREHLGRSVSLRNAEVVRAVWPVPEKVAAGAGAGAGAQ